MSTIPNDSIQTNTVPLIMMRGNVAFPGQPFHIEVGRTVSVNALEYALKHDSDVFLVAQRNAQEEHPKQEDLYTVGCLAHILQILRINDKDVKVVVDVESRAKLVQARYRSDMWMAVTQTLPDTKIRQSRAYRTALSRNIRRAFVDYASLLPNTPPDQLMDDVADTEDLEALVSLIAIHIPAPVDDKQFVLEQSNPVNRAKVFLELMKKEEDLLRIDREISEQVQQQIDDNQREYYLREQIRAINCELYGADTDDDELYYQKIQECHAPDSIKEKLNHEVTKLLKMPAGAQETTVVRCYLDECLALPWQEYTHETIDLDRAAKELDLNFYGLQSVKERILESLAVHILATDIKGQILCLVGPPGVGKTSIAKTIASCMNRRYARIALGGIGDEAEIRGHRRTYLGSMPGKIIKAIEQAGSSNPVLLLDEIDKLSKDYKGDPAAALLEVLDGEQNSSFTDHYLDLPYDLSRVFFITTANSTDGIPAPLLDRLEIIRISGYTREEKFHIAKRHLIPRQIEQHGLTRQSVKITDAALYDILDHYTREAGVRQTERVIAKLCRKAAKSKLEGAERQIIKPADLIERLGQHKYHPEQVMKQDEVGLINGLAWTSVGGEIMQIEAAAVPGTGKVELTGSLGDVMKESAKAAITYVRSRCDRLGISPDFYKDTDLHIHATEGAVPKDGPSAGITMTTALVSALTGRPIRHEVAMTGEITIRGRVLPIGGLKEKSMAAYRGGVKTLILPYDNLCDLDEVDPIVKEHIEFVPVRTEDEVLARALL